MGQEAILRPRIQAALQEALVPSIADKTKLAFAHHQNTAGMFWSLLSFQK